MLVKGDTAEYHICHCCITPQHYISQLSLLYPTHPYITYITAVFHPSHRSHMSSVFKISAGPRTLTSKTRVCPTGFPSLPYINFGKIVLRYGKFQILLSGLCHWCFPPQPFVKGYYKYCCIYAVLCVHIFITPFHPTVAVFHPSHISHMSLLYSTPAMYHISHCCIPSSHISHMSLLYSTPAKYHICHCCIPPQP